MSEPTIAPLDDIATFLPGITSDEYELRAKLRSYRNAATAMVHNTDRNNARAPAWMVIEYVSDTIYAPAHPDIVPALRQLCRWLMPAAMQIEELNA